MTRQASAALSEAAVRTALRDCYHPSLGANIVDLGLVHGIAMTEDASAPGAGIAGVPPRWRVRIDLLAAVPESEAEAQLVAQIQNRLGAFETISRAEINIVQEPAWTPDRIEPALRERLSLAIASRKRSDDLIQIQTTPAASRKGS